MSKTNKSKKSNTVGKGRLTQVQIAFLVGRYLEDHKYSASLTAFRSEAADLFSKIRRKEVPKGLMGLDDILDEYIKLKAEKLLVYQEKSRIENAFQGLQEVMTNYLMPPSQPNLGVNSSVESPSQDQMVYGSFINPAPTTARTSSDYRISSIPVSNCSSGEKRKSPIDAPNPSDFKKNHPASTKKIHAIDANTSSMQASIEKTAIQASSAHIDYPHSEIPAAGNPPPNAIISSEILITSPIKGKDSYSVERSHQVSTSPLKKLSPWKMNKREHVKGRLDFGKSCDLQSSTYNVAPQDSPLLDNFAEASSDYDFELPDFSLFDGELSKLLGDFDVNFCQPQTISESSPSRDHVTTRKCSSVHNVNDGCLEMNRALPNDSTSTGTTELILQKDLNNKNCDALTTKRSTTKRIMISSPCKAERIILKQTQSPEKS